MRLFNGEVFIFENGYKTKTEARQKVQELKEKGNKTRIVDRGRGKGSIRYVVYSRKKGKKKGT